MTLLIDAGALIAQADSADPRHAATVRVLSVERGPLVTSQIVAAEADHLIRRRLSMDAELAFLEDLGDTYRLECMTDGDLEAVRSVCRRYRDLDLGLADASLLVLAARFRTTRILTFDQRHFRAVRPLQGGHFTILPADA